MCSQWNWSALYQSNYQQKHAFSHIIQKAVDNNLSEEKTEHLTCDRSNYSVKMSTATAWPTCPLLHDPSHLCITDLPYPCMTHSPIYDTSHPCITHHTPAWPTPSTPAWPTHPYITHPTLAWPTPPLHDIPHPCMAHPTPPWQTPPYMTHPI